MARSASLGDRRVALDDERRRLVEQLEELDEAHRAMQARKDLLEARRHDIEETPGSRFLRGHKGRAAGLLRDLVEVEAGLERALAAALGPLADAAVYGDGVRALEDAVEGDGATLAIASGGPVPVGLDGERRLLSAVEAQPAARGIVSTVLRDVYLADSLDDAARKHAEHPRASFVTRDGVLIGPSVIHTTAAVDVRLREIHAELQVLAHDLSANEQRSRPRRERLDELASESAFLQGQVDASDAEITAAAESLGALGRVLAGLRKEDELLATRLSALDENVATWRDRLAALGPSAGEEPPELPPLPHAPIQARVAVETLRQARRQHEQRLTHLRGERDELAAHDPARLREELAAAASRTRGGRGCPPPRRRLVHGRERGADRGRGRRALRRRSGGRYQQGVARCIDRAGSAA